MPNQTLVVLFLRGGADGLDLVPPVGDDDYHRARPTLAVRARDAIRLDDRFGLHPELAELEPLFRDGLLAVIHAVGSDDATRSHFSAQDLAEQGAPSAAGGWVGRWLRRRGGDGPLAAVAIGPALAESLRGAPAASTLRSLADLCGAAQGLHGPLAGLYAADPLLAQSAHDAVAAAHRLAGLRTRPAAGADYPSDDPCGPGLADIAALIKAEVGLRAACLDLAGWDSHFVQATVLASRRRTLARGLAAFARDLGPRLATTSVVVMSEFGRRVGENASRGTDHGRGGVAFVLGGGTPGGLHCRWPGLAHSVLDGPGDLPMVHHLRDVIAPVLRRHGEEDPAAVFPGVAIEALPV